MIDPTSMENCNAIFYLLSPTQKMKKCNKKLGELKLCILRSRFLLFCVAHNPKYLKSIFYTFVGYTTGYIRISFQRNIKLINIFFNI